MSKVLHVFVLIFLLSIIFPISAVAERDMLISLMGATTADAPTKISVAQLDKLPQVEKSIFDPFLKKMIRYQGVALAEFVVRFARPETKTIRINAIDDYVVTFSRKDLEADNYLLATRMDGEKMSRTRSGPVKIVLQTEDPDNLFVQKWIWMVNRIEFLSD